MLLKSEFFVAVSTGASVERFCKFSLGFAARFLGVVLWSFFFLCGVNEDLWFYLLLLEFFGLLYCLCLVCLGFFFERIGIVSRGLFSTYLMFMGLVLLKSEFEFVFVFVGVVFECGLS